MLRTPTYSANIGFVALGFHGSIHLSSDFDGIKLPNGWFHFTTNNTGIILGLPLGLPSPGVKCGIRTHPRALARRRTTTIRIPHKKGTEQLFLCTCRLPLITYHSYADRMKLSDLSRFVLRASFPLRGLPFPWVKPWFLGLKPWRRIQDLNLYTDYSATHGLANRSLTN